MFSGCVPSTTSEETVATRTDESEGVTSLASIPKATAESFRIGITVVSSPVQATVTATIQYTVYDDQLLVFDYKDDEWLRESQRFQVLENLEIAGISMKMSCGPGE